jgi:lysophospholipase L1-like esterase
MRSLFTTATSHFPARLVLLLMLPLLPLTARGEVNGFGSMGDSLTDEYAEESYDYAFSWVQQLELFRAIACGPTAVEAGQPGGTWGEPRRTGYQFNWARSGADSQDLLDDGQHTGLAALVPEHGITHAAIMIGANDFYPLPLPGYPYFMIYHNLWSESQIDAYVAQIVGRIEQALDTVLPTGVSCALCTVPDYGVTPLPRLLFPDPTKRERVAAVIEQVNAELESVAQTRHLVVVDIYAGAQAVFGTHAAPREILLMGNVEIYVQEQDTPDNDDPQAGFVDDGVHPHTHLQGIMANLVLQGLNSGWHADVPLFSEAEMLAHAGLAYGGADTLAGEIGSYAEYVRDYTLPDGDLNQDTVVDADDFAIFAGCMAGPQVQQPPDGCDPAAFNRADVNGDYDVDVGDFYWMQASVGTSL